MTRALAAEMVKLRTTRLVWGLLAGTLAWVLLSVSLTLAFAGQEGGPDVTGESGVRLVLSQAGSCWLFVLILGVLGMTTELRHNTLVPTFLAIPRRGGVVLAKMVVYAGVGLGFAVLSALVVVAVAVPWLAIKDTPVDLGSTAVLLSLGGTVLAGALYGALGVAVGALLRNQVLALIAVVVYSMLVEGLLVGLLPEVGRFLPGGAASALARTPTAELLPAWGGALLLVAYTVVIAAAATRFVVRRDV